MRDVKRAYSIDEVVCGGHVAPGTELVDFDTDRVDDVVDTVLDDNCAGACHVHFDGEARGSLEAVGGVGDAAVFAENARAAYGATDNRNVVEVFAGATEREVIGPVLRRDGIAKAHQRKVFLFGENVDGVEEINPVRFAREIVGKCGAFRKVAVTVLAARKRARDGCACVHLCEIGEVKAHVESFASGHIECDFVTQDFFARRDGGGRLAAERDRGWGICGGSD